jgi:hypothetical protein
MKIARILFLAGTAALAGASVPSRAEGQAAKRYPINVANPQSVTGGRFNMHQRLRVEVQGLNPFVGNYRIIVNEKAYSDSAISQFLAGLGISVPVGAPQSREAREGVARASGAAAGLRELLRREDSVRAQCDPACADAQAAARSVVRQFAALEDTLRGLDRQDTVIHSLFRTVTSERSEADSVMAALGSVIEILRQRAYQLHHVRAFSQMAASIASQADALKKRLEPCACAASARAALDTVILRGDDIKVAAGWGDTLLARAGRALPALEVASLQAREMFVHVFEIGDYDYPTTVDIRIQRQPLGPLNFAARPGQETAALTGGTPTGTGTADTTVEAGWRTVANPRLSFGQRRRIGLGGALVLGIGPRTNTFGAAYTETTDSISRITITRRERVWTPLLTLTARLWAVNCFDMVCSFNLHMGIAPSVTTRQTYFGGAGFAFADERVGIMVGLLSVPVQMLGSGSPGDKLNRLQASPVTREGRVERWAVGLNLRPF